MDKLVLALAPGFAAGFAVQRLRDRGRGPRVRVRRGLGQQANAEAVRPDDPVDRSRVRSAIGTGVRVLQPLGATGVDAWDVVVTALVVSAGTEGANSNLKYLGYKKDEQKVETAKLG